MDRTLAGLTTSKGGRHGRSVLETKRGVRGPAETNLLTYAAGHSNDGAGRSLAVFKLR